ncbi:MAG: pyridoxal phosphate-dependent cell wall biosynthesis enzyme [Chlorobi bacterium OLB4]|jgi:Predicted pyridoxal phosphate-dependent enzyme apparently involved in regulation of cell wall biogenesis|nr:MAG: pyridoxal phosphate-dependent cell wall biosynthesis enzyme [Chlorobi bacterium OLB4]MBW7856413.1 DegT/DnrJ/EryC1/StrS family aminotransferase [Ignavibacteria bacterium]OQY78734.1 MAG: aminotransferase DegT [Ignavibacteriales bacterium UTCHB1]
MKIPISKPFFDEKDLEIINEPLISGWVTQGVFVQQFEDTFRKFISANYAVAVSSGTTALHTALAALKISKGDEVILPAFSWVATANAVEYCGAKPVFCDIEPDTFNIDPQEIEKHITPETKAIIPVHLFGLPVAMDIILEIARRYKLKVVEDSACGFGSYYKNNHVGIFGDAGCFSFHPRKAVTTGEGGMVVTSDEELDKKFRELRNHGASQVPDGQSLLSEYNVLGFNYRMTDIQGALGVSQMEKASEILTKRILAAEYYDKLLKNFNKLRKPVRGENCVHSYQSYVCMLKSENTSNINVDELNRKRNLLMQMLSERGISTRQGTHAITNLGYYVNKYRINPGDFPNAYASDKLSIALPLFAQITREEQDFVVDNLKELFKKSELMF